MKRRLGKNSCRRDATAGRCARSTTAAEAAASRQVRAPGCYCAAIDRRARATRSLATRVVTATLADCLPAQAPFITHYAESTPHAARQSRSDLISRCMRASRLQRTIWILSLPNRLRSRVDSTYLGEPLRGIRAAWATPIPRNCPRRTWHF